MSFFDTLKNVVDHTKEVWEQKIKSHLEEDETDQDNSFYSPDALDEPPEYTVAKALFAVAQNEQTTIRAYLAHNRKFANAHDWTDLTLLHKAAQFGRVEIVQALLENGADADARFQCKTPLHLAVSTDEMWIKANIKQQSPTEYQNHRREIVKILLAAGTPIEVFDERGESALHSAARLGQGAVVQMLLEHGTDINLRTQVAEPNSPYSGRSPLLVVAKTSKNIKMLEYLLKQGAQPNIQDEDPGFTALQYLAITPYVDQIEREKLLAACVMLLLNHGANPNLAAKTKRGQHALHFAAANRHLAMVETLLAKGADIAAKTESGHQPVELAAQRDHIDIVQLFLRKGVNPYDSRLLFHAASNAKSMQLLQYLVEQEHLDFNQPDPQGYTPIFAAVNANSLKNVSYLVEKGADLTLHPPGLTLTQMAYSNWGGTEALPESQREQANANSQGIIRLLEEKLGAKRPMRTEMTEPEKLLDESEMLPPIPTGDQFSLMEEDAPMETKK